MKVTLLHATPIDILDKSLTKCWASDCKTGDDMMARIDRIINKNKHGSIAEHCQVNIDVIGVSRALLQEVSRHRHASLSVKSSRYTLKELKDETFGFISEKPISGWLIAKNGSGIKTWIDIDGASKYIVLTDDDDVDACSTMALNNLRLRIIAGISNDKAKYCMPEAYKTDFTWTLNIRSLMNMLSLRTDKSALWEFRDLANNIFNILPKEYQFLLKDYVKEV